MDYELQHLVDGKRIVEISATPIPTPPNSAHPGESLYVNCHYSVDMARLPLSELFESARSDAEEIFRCLASQSEVGRFVRSLVTVWGHFPASKLERPARRRIYQINVATSPLLSNALSISLKTLLQAGAFESSQLDDIADLLNYLPRS